MEARSPALPEVEVVRSLPKLKVHKLIINRLATNFPVPLGLKQAIFFRIAERSCSPEINL